MLNIFKKTTWRPKSDSAIEKPLKDIDADVSLVHITKIDNDVFRSRKKSSKIMKDEVARKVSTMKPIVNAKPKEESRKVSWIGKSPLLRWSSLRLSKRPKQPEIDEDKIILKLRKASHFIPKADSNENLVEPSHLQGISKSLIPDTEDLERRKTRAAISVYVLDHLMTAKRQEMLENMYGGKHKSNDAAITIQRWFRNVIQKQNERCNLDADNVNIRHSVNPAGDRISSYKENGVKSRSKSKSRDVSEGSDYDPSDPFKTEKDPDRRRLFNIGINMFNRYGNKGIQFLIDNKILDTDPLTIVKFFDSKGISSYAKGDFLSQDNNDLALETRRQFIEDMSFHNCSLEKSIRVLFSFIRIPGETQKILIMLEDFCGVYLSHNPEFEKQLKKPDSVVLMAFGILMLHTSLFNPSARKQDRMSKENFVSLFKNINEETIFTDEYLTEIYDNIKSKQMRPLKDHTDIVRNIYSQLSGSLLPKDFLQNHRKLVCQYNFNEVPNVTKKEGNHLHTREVFLFNDLILITKKNSKNTDFHIRHVLPLYSLQTLEFQTPYYKFGLTLVRKDLNSHKIHLNCFTNENRQKFLNDCNQYIEEVCELERVKANSVYRGSTADK